MEDPVAELGPSEGVLSCAAEQSEDVLMREKQACGEGRESG